MSLIGSGKYDGALAAARQVSGATTSVFVVLNGERGRGFSVYGLKVRLKRLPALLRQVADDIESSLNREDERHE